MEILAVLFVALIIWLTIGKGFMEGLRGSGPTSLRPEDVFRWPPEGEYDFDIVGESNYQPALKALAGDHGEESADKECTALIVPEDNNPHDGSAVRVDIDGSTVGYLSREDARRFRRRLGAKKMGKNPTCCAAMVVGGFRLKNGLLASYGVKLDIKLFDT